MIGKKLSNRYEITGELGRGGMGVVYRARDPLLDREVAIKLIPPTMLNPETEQRFQHEAKLVAQMDHPAIVSIFDFGFDDGLLFFVMPVVKGRTLTTLLREETLRDAIVEQYYGKDLVLGRTFRWGSGFMLTSDVLPLGPNPHVFGHGGWGGSLGFADLDARVSWAYIMNKMSPGTTGDFRVAGMLAGLYSSL